MKNTVIQGYSLMPCFIDFSAAADNDQKIYKKLQLPQGSFLVFDKGYNSYHAFANFTNTDIYFITRQKENAVFTQIIECLHDETTPSNITKESTITKKYQDEDGQTQILKLRLVACYDEKQNRCYEFIPNNFELDAATIPQLYQSRWKIELFFKKLKQNFQLQYFVGANPNVNEIQIRMTLIALLLLSVIHQNIKTNMALSVFVTIIKLHLFNYINIRTLLTEYKKKSINETYELIYFAKDSPCYSQNQI